MLNSSIVVIGKKNLNPGRSMMTSPGKRNSGSFAHPRPQQADHQDHGSENDQDAIHRALDYSARRRLYIRK